jgi:hypothetical protein
LSILTLREYAADKTNFVALHDFYDFAKRYLDLIAGGALQAQIVARNENTYRFFQYKEEAEFAVTRPINSTLYYSADDFDAALCSFSQVLEVLKQGEEPLDSLRPIVRRVIYTTQQSIGAALDALPAGRSNTARKVNGDLFERFIRLLVQSLGFECISGVVRVPIFDDAGTELFKMSYQHDMILSVDGELRAIGSVKTSSKDRIDKIFIDKFLYSKLTATDLPHVAIFLNDVQRKGVLPNFGINGTFLAGHFKGYTVKLNPLDGVYYCDIRPNMVSDRLLSKHIDTIDTFFYETLPRLTKPLEGPLPPIEIEAED